MREYHRENRLEPVAHTTVTYTCDKCGMKISWDEHEGENTAHELILILDQEQCVNFYRRRDYCDNCFEPIWRTMNTLIGVDDPYVERDREYDEERLYFSLLMP